MIPFEKVAGLWKGGGFWGEPDQEFADCERSVMPGPCCSGRGEGPEWEDSGSGRPVDELGQRLGFEKAHHLGSLGFVAAKGPGQRTC